MTFRLAHTVEYFPIFSKSGQITLGAYLDLLPIRLLGTREYVSYNLDEKSHVWWGDALKISLNLVQTLYNIRLLLSDNFKGDLIKILNNRRFWTTFFKKRIL